MKADYLHFIFECLSGDDGLLSKRVFPQFFNVTEKFDDEAEKRFGMEINENEIQIDCEVCEEQSIIDGKNFHVKHFYENKEMTLLEYMHHEVLHEYEQAKRCIFEKNFNQTTVKNEDGREPEMGIAPFHPIFMSSLMNQQVYKRQCMLEDQKRKEEDNKDESVKIRRETQEKNKKIIETI